MKRIVSKTLAFAAIMAMAAWAGALVLEVGNPDTDPEAKSLNAVVVARATACHDPAKSTVTATLVQFTRGELQRTQLKVLPLKAAGTFAVIGAVPHGSVIDLAVTNPEYRNYQPRVLIRGDGHGVDLASTRRFFSTQPTETDIRSVLGAVD
ncbi:MAG: hypothetical protein M3Z85_18080 [Acidobacteriota bacterium]|nr:hypothetical protein [Acidobacteriota bacterium]